MKKAMSCGLPNGVVRVTGLPYKIVQTPKLVVLLSEGNTHSYRRFFFDGRPNIAAQRGSTK